LPGTTSSSTSSVLGAASACVTRVAAAAWFSAASRSRVSAGIRLPGFTTSASVRPIVTATAVVNM
jgi:hypothetical protein